MSVRHACLLALMLASCYEAPLPAREAPQFKRTPSSSSIENTRIDWQAGETMSWGVRWRGMQVGTASLQVQRVDGQLYVESRFATLGLAEQVNPVRHHLLTPARLSASSVDDLHSALARVRAWARADALPAHLRVRQGSELYVLKLAQPVADRSQSVPSLRVEAQAKSPNRLIDITLWVSDDPKRMPLRVILAQGTQQVQATIIDASSESRPPHIGVAKGNTVR